MCELKRSDPSNRRRFFCAFLLGILVMAVVFVIATRSDLKATERIMASTASYVKEQCTRYARIELASETKSLMRVTESCKQLAHQLAEADGADSADALKTYTGDCYVSGVLLLNAQGKVTAQYHTEGQAPEELADYLDSSSLLDTGAFPEKRYAAAISCADGSQLDLAAVKREDQPGIVAVYYHTSAEYLEAFSLSMTSMLSGYDLKSNGTIVVSNGSTIVSSNDPSLIGSSTDDLAILRKIKAASTSRKLTHTKQEDSAIAQYFGMMERGRDFYVYAFLPEHSVFSNTPRIMLYALVLYLIILGALSASRRRTEQRYQEKQLRSQKQYANTLRAKNEQLRLAVAQADQANAAKTSFLSRMSHDIRTPLNGILGLLQIDAAHPDNTALLNANREKMRVAADHLLSLINDVLQMSKLESGEIVLAHEALDLDRLAVDVLTIVEQRAAGAGITLEHDPRSDPVDYPYVYGSPLHLRQIFLNIYTNCVKYNQPGGRISTLFQCLDHEKDTVTYRWTITDTGIGMSEEFLQHIFDPFTQESTDARSVYQGTGLGMTIVKSLIEKMNGTIAVTSTVGVGSTFLLTIPFEIAEPPAEPPQPAVADAAADLHGLHLLLAEDNALNAEIAELLLADAGAKVTHVGNGQEAVSRFRHSPPGTFDAILMDIMMPVMDGLAATRAIRALDRPDAKTIPILAMTANAFDEDAQACLSAGMNAHLSKPLQMQKVKQAILEQTGRKS